MNEVDVLAAGPLTTVQDHGRPGLAHLGVPPSGAVDSRALALGNRLVGNDVDAAALEATLIGPRLRFREAAVVALTGAEVGLGANAVVRVAAGEVLEIGPCLGGARAYICVRGGFDVPRVLGSRSTDVLTGIGPPPLRDGDVLRVGPAPDSVPHADVVPVRPSGSPVALRVLPGPREDWFAAGALDSLFAAHWTVSQSANRVGVRLDGPALEWGRDDELQSEGLVTGALQVPPSGRPILLLNDHPTTGGYPVIGVVHSSDVAAAGQLRPGDSLRFRRDS